MTKLQEAVWETFRNQVLAGKGASSMNDMVNQYGFTGPFSGLDEYYLDQYQMLNDLEEEIQR
jgi:hypothetical protein